MADINYNIRLIVNEPEQFILDWTKYFGELTPPMRGDIVKLSGSRFGEHEGRWLVVGIDPFLFALCRRWKVDLTIPTKYGPA